mgnify:FL=1
METQFMAKQRTSLPPGLITKEFYIIDICHRMICR